MKTVIFCSGCHFPISIIAGSIYMGKLPLNFQKGTLWDTFCSKELYKNIIDVGCCLGETPDGTRVMAFSAPSSGHLLGNLTSTFLEINCIIKKTYHVVEIPIHKSTLLSLGQMLLKWPITRPAGRRVIESCLEKIYPQLVQAVKLDGNFQISDN